MFDQLSNIATKRNTTLVLEGFSNHRNIAFDHRHLTCTVKIQER